MVDGMHMKTPMAVTGHQPLRGAVAWLLTRDETFVAHVLKDHRYEPSGDPLVMDGPIAMAFALTSQMVSDGAFIEQRGAIDTQSLRPGSECVINRYYWGRFKKLTAKIMEQETSSKGLWTGDWAHLVFVPIVDECVSEVCRQIKNGSLVAHAVPVHAGAVGKAGELSPSYITDTMTLGNDGMLHQEGGERQRVVPAYKQVTVNWEQLLDLFPAPEPLTDKERKPLAVQEAINGLGIENVAKMSKKDRKKTVGNWVSTHHGLSVGESLIENVLRRLRKAPSLTLN